MTNADLAISYSYLQRATLASRYVLDKPKCYSDLWVKRESVSSLDRQLLVGNSAMWPSSAERLEHIITAKQTIILCVSLVMHKSFTWQVLCNSTNWGHPISCFGPGSGFYKIFLQSPNIIPTKSKRGNYLRFFFLIKSFLLLFYYSCPNFAPPFALFCPSHSPPSQSIPTLLSMPMVHSFMFFF